MLRFLTAGESHGECLVAILEGMPSGLTLTPERINQDLARRQLGYGRGGRMTIEKDQVRILSGVRRHVTIGAPITLIIPNKDTSIDRLPIVTKPRPGHADLVGVLKYDRGDARDILERASARETAMRVAAGGVAKALLSEFDVRILSHVVMLGGVEARVDRLSFAEIQRRAERSPVRCADPRAARRMIARIDQARRRRDTAGGVYEVMVQGLPPGLGSYAQFDRRLTGQLAGALLSIPAMKGVEVGIGFQGARLFGSQVHDPIYFSRSRGFYRKTNRAGGLEGGITTGMALLLRAAMKPLSTLLNALPSVDIHTKRATRATVERSDITAVPAAGVVGEAVVALVLAGAFIDKFGGDSMAEMKRNYRGYLKQLRDF